MLRVNDSTNIVLRRLAIRGGFGVRIDRSTVRTDTDITIEDSRGNGLGVSGGSVVTVGNSGSDTANLIQNNCGRGASTGFGSSLSFRGTTTIQSNRNGVHAREGGLVRLSPGTDETDTPNEMLIQDNELRGVSAVGLSRVTISGRVIIKDNSGLPSDDPAFPFRAAVRVRFGGVLAITGNRDDPGRRPIIEDNDGPGVLADVQAKVFLSYTNIHDNQEGGLFLLHDSVAESFEGNIMSGNGIADAKCDKTSLLFGDLSGIDKVKCSSK